MTVDTSSARAEDLARSLLRRLQVSAKNKDMLDDEIQQCSEILTEAARVLNQITNARSPILKLPVELLCKILEHIPDPLNYDGRLGRSFRPFWKYSAVSSSTLLPITHTCRSLRSIALSHHYLWSTIPIVTESQDFLRTLESRSQRVPLSVVVSPSTQFTRCLDSFYPAEAYRIQELHLFNIGHRHAMYLASLLAHDSPMLQSFSFSGRSGDVRKWFTDVLPLSRASTTSLKDLYINQVPLLPNAPLPVLTHLALHSIYMPDVHNRIARLLRNCPNLQAVVLSDVMAMTDDEFHHEPNARPLQLRALRRVTLNIHTRYHQFYFSLLQPHTRRFGLQVFCCNTNAFAPYSYSPITQYLHGAATHLSINVANVHDISVSAVGAEGALHLSHEALNISLSDLFSDRSALSNVRKLWVKYGYDSGGYFGHPLQTVVASLPALETLVIICDGSYSSPALDPDLGPCPTSQDPNFDCHSLKTLCVVCHNGCTGLTGTTLRPARGVRTLRLQTMLEQLKRGAYSYFDHLVVQLVEGMVLHEASLESLRGHFAEVRVEYIVELPTMPLPDFCIEPKTDLAVSRALHPSSPLWF